MQRFASVAIALHDIARDSTEVAASRRRLLRAQLTGNGLAHARTTGDLYATLRRLTSRVEALHPIVTGFDRDIAGTEVGSLAELVLRGQTLAVLLVLDDVYPTIRRDADAYRPLFTGRFRSIDDVIAWLSDELYRVNRLWLGGRITRTAGDRSTDTHDDIDETGSARYHAGIRRAQDAMRAIGTAPDFARFLRAGSAHAEPSIRAACEQLGAILRLHPTLEPAFEVLGRAQPANL